MTENMKTTVIANLENEGAFQDNGPCFPPQLKDFVACSRRKKDTSQDLVKFATVFRGCMSDYFLL